MDPGKRAKLENLKHVLFWVEKSLEEYSFIKSMIDGEGLDGTLDRKGRAYAFAFTVARFSEDIHIAKSLAGKLDVFGNGLPFKSIKRFRNNLVHNYENVDIHTVLNKVPVIVSMADSISSSAERLRRMIRKLESSLSTPLSGWGLPVARTPEGIRISRYSDPIP